ncbi:hypothetical protein [Halovivax sp.]|uniref:hypothetical protein n=1 Tax=Halovivax sp. TaxID=1935978 RepID=UPI0025BE1849|nr:hypothetical protein [Halovivax sp.]
MVGTAIGFVLGAIVGAIATAAGSTVLYWKRERDATRRLRRALAEEVRTYEYLDEMVNDGDYEPVTERVEEPVVYESAAGELGRLDEREIDALVGFYGDVRWLRGSRIRRTRRRGSRRSSSDDGTRSPR